MKLITRDITITLLVKLCLLIVLWFVCFRTSDPPHQHLNSVDKIVQHILSEER